MKPKPMRGECVHMGRILVHACRKPNRPGESQPHHLHGRPAGWYSTTAERCGTRHFQQREGKVVRFLRGELEEQRAKETVHAPRN
jgi:hypothetical protein